MATAVRALAADRAPYALYGVKCIDLVPLALFSGEFAIVNLDLGPRTDIRPMILDLT